MSQPTKPDEPPAAPIFRSLTPKQRERNARVNAVMAYAARAAIAARQAHQLWPDAADTHNPAMPIPTPLAEPRPARAPVDGATLLDDMTAHIERHLALPALSAATLVLWALHTWSAPAHTVSPRLAFVSPEPHAGKTTALRLLAQLTPRPLIAAHARAAPLLVMIDFMRPTLLLDDAERWPFANRVLRAVIAAGHARDARMIRESNTPFELPAHSCYCPCAIALTGRVSDDLARRSIQISLTPMLPGEQRARLKPAVPSTECEEMRAKCVRWSRDHFAALAGADPDMPSDLSPGARDLWRPLFAIADVAGGDWPDQARNAALTLSAGTEARSLSAELLHDIREAFADCDRLSTEALLNLLTRNAERPWQRMARGRPLNAHELARRLAAFHIRPRTMRFADGIVRGYFVSDFADAFARYLGPRVHTALEIM